MTRRTLTKLQLRDLAHAARMHFEHLQRIEGRIPTGEQEILKLAIDIECSWRTDWSLALEKDDSRR